MEDGFGEGPLAFDGADAAALHGGDFFDGEIGVNTEEDQFTLFWGASLERFAGFIEGEHVIRRGGDREIFVPFHAFAEPAVLNGPFLSSTVDQDVVHGLDSDADEVFFALVLVLGAFEQAEKRLIDEFGGGNGLAGREGGHSMMGDAAELVVGILDQGVNAKI